MTDQAKHGILPGIANSMQWVVSSQHLASTWGSGLADVLATPVLVGFCEEVARQSVDGLLPPGQQTVGTKVVIDHLAATPCHMKVFVRSTLTTVDGRHLVFSIEAMDEQECVARCEHHRFIIDADRFADRISKKSRSKECPASPTESP